MYKPVEVCWSAFRIGQKEGPYMTLNQLECFSVLAQRLSFTQAADELFMTQSALSRTIATLEQELKVQLFHRNSRCVSLTPAGVAFLRECPAILDSYRRSLEAARLAQQGYEGQITMGILRDDFEPIVIDIYRAMKAKYPGICLSLREYSHSDLFRQFVAGRLDVILNFGFDHSHSLDCLRGQCDKLCLRRNQQCAIVPADLPLAKKPHVRMEELRDMDFVIMSRTSSWPGHDFLQKVAADAGFVPNIVAEASHVPALLTMVACGIGVSTLTSDLEHLAQGRVAFLPLIGVPLSPIELIWQKDLANPSMPLLLDVVQKEVLPLLEQK